MIRQLKASVSNAVSEVLRHRIVEVKQVASIVLAISRGVPDEFHAFAEFARQREPFLLYS